MCRFCEGVPADYYITEAGGAMQSFKSLPVNIPIGAADRLFNSIVTVIRTVGLDARQKGAIAEVSQLDSFTIILREM